MSRFYLLVWLVFSAPFASAWEIEPFRLEQIKPRDFRLTENYYFDRFTYRFPNDWRFAWMENPEGFRLTAGSVSSKELYSFQELRKSVDLGDGVFGRIEYLRDEDLDSRYNRFLVGLGVTGEHQFMIRGNVEPEKGNIDIIPEATFRGQYGQLRLAASLTDSMFNEKSENDLEYVNSAMTYYAEYRNKFSDSILFGAYTNVTPDIELDGKETSVRASFNQTNFGMFSKVELDDLNSFLIEGDSRVGERFREGDEDAFFLNRELRSGNIEYHRLINERLRAWIGFYRLTLTGESSSRSEKISHFGIKYLLSEKLIFRPSLYLNKTKGKEEREWDELRTRVLFPIEYSFSERAVGSFAAALENPKGPFGGFMAQVQFKW